MRLFSLLKSTGWALAGIALALAAVSCVKDGSEPCENKIRIVYDYNVDYVDKFHVQVTHFTLFAFDAATGFFDHEIKMTGNPFSEDFEMDAPASLFGKTFDLVVWAGLDPDSYSFPTLQKGVSKKEDLEVMVKGYQDKRVDRTEALEPLWHGMLADVKFDRASGRTKTISLTKDTNIFRLVVKSYLEGYPVDVDEFDVTIGAANGWMGYDNTVRDDKDAPIEYMPYYRSNESAGSVYELNTLRLRTDRENTLYVKRKGSTVFEMDLNEYLELLKLLDQQKMDFQEYLDREDEFRIIVLLTGVNPGPGPGDETWISVQVMINEWVVREHELTGGL